MLLSFGWQPVHELTGSGVWPITESFKVKIWIRRYLRITDMQLLILNANSIIWGVGKSLNWNHMKKHFEFFFFNAVRKMALVEKLQIKYRRIPTQRKAGNMTKQGGLTASNLLHHFSQ